MAAKLPPGVNRRYAILAGVAFGAIWLWVALDRPYKLPSHHIPWTSDYDLLFPWRADNLVDAFDFPPVDSESIKSICGDTQWNDSVVFTCDESVGGIGNIRNSVLICIRYAISAGASIVIPTIVVRNSSDISNIRTGEKTDLSYMFDVQHFLDSMRLSCPSMKIYPSLNHVDNFKETLTRNRISLIPESLVEKVPNTGLSNPQAWRGQFYTWLEQFSSTGVAGPMIVNLGRSYLTYPIYSDGESFAETFGSILKFRSDVRVLATKTLQALSETHSISLDLTKNNIPNAFFGAHLRTEKDAVEGWPAPDWLYSRYETQSRLYLTQAPRSNSSIIYVASGDLKEVAKFAADASNSPGNLTVTTKFNLLKEKDLEELQALKWDQQGLVDFLVMLKASDFAGIGHSSFAWNVALKRHVFVKKKDQVRGPEILMGDELSLIYGDVRGYEPEYAACLWP